MGNLIQNLSRFQGYEPPTNEEVSKVLSDIEAELKQKIITSQVGKTLGGIEKMETPNFYVLSHGYNQKFEIKPILTHDEMVYSQKKLLEFMKNERNKVILNMFKSHAEKTLYEHSLRIAFIHDVITNKDLKIQTEDISAPLLHDIGKLIIPSEILNREKQILSDEEIILVKKHPEAGYLILEGLEYSKEVQDLALNHHRRLDGTGYPPDFNPLELSPQDRLIMAEDTYDSIVYGRGYTGKFYSPNFAALFLALKSGLIEIKSLEDLTWIEESFKNYRLEKDKKENKSNLEELIKVYPLETKPIFDPAYVEPLNYRVMKSVA